MSRVIISTVTILSVNVASCTSFFFFFEVHNGKKATNKVSPQLPAQSSRGFHPKENRSSEGVATLQEEMHLRRPIAGLGRYCGTRLRLQYPLKLPGGFYGIRTRDL